jgi:hypothetical protein
MFLHSLKTLQLTEKLSNLEMSDPLQKSLGQPHADPRLNLDYQRHFYVREMVLPCGQTTIPHLLILLIIK